MDITYTHTISFADYSKLRASAGWPQICAEQAEAGLKNSSFVIVAQDGAEPVGMVRLVADGGYIVYVADVLVLPKYQRKGIGTEMMNRLVTYTKENMKSRYQIHFVLMSVHGKEQFYEHFGFFKRPDGPIGHGMTQWLSKQ